MDKLTPEAAMDLLGMSYKPAYTYYLCVELSGTYVVAYDVDGNVACADEQLQDDFAVISHDFSYNPDPDLSDIYNTEGSDKKYLPEEYCTRTSVYVGRLSLIVLLILLLIGMRCLHGISL